MRDRLTILVCVAVAACSSAPAAGQIGGRLDHFLQLDPLASGARSAAMGGVWVALDGDAGASASNPATATGVTRPTVVVEGRSASREVAAPSSGRISGAPTGLGVDTVAELRTTEIDFDEGADLALVGVVYPWSDLRVFAHMRRVVDARGSLETRGAFLEAPREGEPTTFRHYPRRFRSDLQVREYGGGLAVELTPRLSIGLQVSRFDLDWTSEVTAFELDGEDRTAPGGFFGPASFDAGNVAFRATTEGSGGHTRVTGGVSWEASDALTVAAVYRQGTVLEYESHDTRSITIGFSRVTGELAIPARFGLGMSWAFSERTTLAAEWVRVRWSEVATADWETAPYRDLEIDDGDELRIGLERVVGSERRPVALRLGAWLDPAHEIEYRGPATTAVEQSLAAFYPGGDDEIHVTAGLGVRLRGGRLGIDLAVDLSEAVDVASLSLVGGF